MHRSGFLLIEVRRRTFRGLFCIVEGRWWWRLRERVSSVYDMNNEHWSDSIIDVWIFHKMLFDWIATVLFKFYCFFFPSIRCLFFLSTLQWIFLNQVWILNSEFIAFLYEYFASFDYSFIINRIFHFRLFVRCSSFYCHVWYDVFSFILCFFFSSCCFSGWKMSPFDFAFIAACFRYGRLHIHFDEGKKCNIPFISLNRFQFFQ